jgi:putative ABC transport system permease protein
MNKKLFTQLYNERRSNAWLLIELLLVSVVLWYVIDTLFVTLTTYTDSKGFDITNTYKLDIEYQDEKSPDYIPNRTQEELHADMGELVNRLRRHSQVEAVSVSQYSHPYNGGNSTNSVQMDTLKSNYWSISRRVTPDFFRVFRYRGANGETPEQLAGLLKEGVFMASRNLFQPQHDIDLKEYRNQRFTLGNDTITSYPLVAALEVVRYGDFRQAGDSRSTVTLLPENELSYGRELCIRVREGVSPTFMEDFMKEADTQYRVGNLFITKIRSFESIRYSFQLDDMNALRNNLVAAGFLLVNIFLGLLGTFWFRTQQRRSEIALMMALGASKREMFIRLISEGIFLLAIVTPLAMLIDFNIGYAELTPSWNFSSVSAGRFFICSSITFALMALMILLGIWFPARKAMDIQLAETLHED